MKKTLLIVLFLALVLCGCTAYGSGGVPDLQNIDEPSLLSALEGVPEPSHDDIVDKSEESEAEKSEIEVSEAEASEAEVSEAEASEAEVTDSEVSDDTEERKVINYSYVKAIWVSQFDMSAIFRLDENGYRSAVGKMLDNIVSDGLNTVIFQIRPYGDSFYESEYYPVSRFTATCDYDAVGIFVQACHDRGLSVHAWINPYRLETLENMLAVKNTVIREWFLSGSLLEWQGRYYLDPSSEEAKKLICDGAREALLKYDFDGLHMDDYFYPTTDSAFDGESFKASGESDLTAFREGHVNDLVKRLYAVTKELDGRLLYGISPAGNINSVRSVYCADVEKWCSEDGFIDYIMPQVYFGFLHASCPFDKTVDRWGGIIKNPDVRLIIGITLSKACSNEPDRYAGTEEGKNEWLNNKDVIARELEYVYSSKYACGFTLFCYQYLYDPLSGAQNSALAEERSSFEKLLCKK